MKYRICYKKTSSLIFISQLDMQNALQRSFRRAGLDLMFSEGFNPHPKLSYTPALPLFVSSDEEYVDVELEGNYDAKQVYEKLYKLLPDGLIINSIKECNVNSVALSSLADWAAYEIILKPENTAEITSLIDAVNTLFNSGCIEILKKNKKRELVKKDISSQINFAKASETDGGLILVKCVLSSRNESLLNPFSLVAGITQNIPQAAALSVLTINKIKTFINA